MKTSTRLRSVAVLAAILTAGSALAAPYKAGDKVQPFRATTQHGKEYSFDAGSTRFLLVSHDMETAKRANAVLTAFGPDNLAAKQAVYLANIHGMPGVGRMFALPKMRKYSHTIILGDDAELIARFPSDGGKVAVLKLLAGKVVSVAFWNPGTDRLEDFLK